MMMPLRFWMAHDTAEIMALMIYIYALLRTLGRKEHDAGS
jgi:hypothetical protein